jgi:hypothetical protein
LIVVGTPWLVRTPAAAYVSVSLVCHHGARRPDSPSSGLVRKSSSVTRHTLLLSSQAHEHAAHHGGAKRLHAHPNLRLDKRLFCRLEMDLHAAELAPAAGGLHHSVAHATDERLPRDPIAAREQPMRPQDLELLVGPELDGLPEHGFHGPDLGRPG